MKYCFVIAEYNPFHYGHLKHLDYIKSELKAENLVVILSGNFTQRGEPAVLNKFTRAKHAILSGADIVIELPTVFATSSAEHFATGGIKLISSLNVEGGLCFGVESGRKEEYISFATALQTESKEFKKCLKNKLDEGISYVRARYEALKETGEELNEELISSPNNILGVEYTKAIIKNNSKITVYPMIRDGHHNDNTLHKGITSATSIRESLTFGKTRKLKKCMPLYVYEDLSDYPVNFDKIIMSSLLRADTKELKEISDCNEGLENRIKALSVDNLSVNKLIEKVSTKRYTSARIRRILINNLLGIKEDFVKKCLSENLYAKVLAVKKDKTDIISDLCKNSAIPLLTRKTDCEKLKGTAKECFSIDTLANNIYNLAANENSNENFMLIV